MQRRVSAVEARQRLGDLLNSVHYNGDEVLIERAGKVMGVIIPLHRYDVLEAKRRRFFEIVDQIHERNKDVPYEVIQREVDQAVAEVRAAEKAQAETT